MKNNNYVGWFSALIVCSLIAPTMASADMASGKDQFSLRTSVYYTTGKYGRAISTDIYYLPVTAKYATGLWAFDLTIPYIRIDGPGNVIPDLGAVGAPSSSRSTQSGLGDVRIGTSYRVFKNADKTLAVDLALKAKFGTADRAKGLGTGENDYAFQVNTEGVLGPLITGGSLGYRLQGSPPGLKLRNVLYGEADVGYRFSSVDSIGISLLASQASTGNSSSRVLTTGHYKHVFTSNWATELYALKGYSNASPDYGGGLSISYAFTQY